MNLNQQVESYYSDLSSQLAILKKYNSQSQRYLSSEFNVFNYINPDENKLSDVIADLLNPNGKHGQGNVFLNDFLNLIESKYNEYIVDINPLVYREASTFLIQSTQKRIDVLVDWNDYGILIENKPWATDQPLQLADYAEYMRRRYGQNFLIIYLTKFSKSPAGHSIAQTELDVLINNGQYINITYSLGFSKWLRNCQNLCQSDKYRWFIRDFNDFVNYQI